MAPLSFAVVGCGRIAGHHADHLADLPRARLAAVCDLQPERAEAYARKHGVPAYTNYHEMLRREQIDVVNILTPSGMHPEHALDAMERYGKHVILEKPMALAWEDVQTLRRTAERAGVKIFPVYQNRYNKAVRKVRAALASGELGRPVLGTVRVRWCRPQAYYRRDPWRGTWAMDGGALTNQGIHYIDLVRYIVGDIDAVNARTATQLVDIEVEDTAVATIRFASGALGVIEVTTAARPDDFEASISVLAERGTAVLQGIAANELAVFTPAPDERALHSEIFPNAYGLGHRPFLLDVVADLLDGRPHPISFEEGTQALRLLNAIYRSAEDGREVRLAEDVASRRLGRKDDRLAALYRVSPPAAGEGGR
ncbi:MAG TPA: Gfo/Idh/MocA family oxidoreductase [Candidatus Acidoferrum sp.]|nr:Gfo/Idh/MocA family oxidoreductase [Candidatus Acidoferrum sp.]